jgi:hypothetical protein
MKKTKHNLYSDFCPFSPISQVEQWPQAKRAATYQAKC